MKIVRAAGGVISLAVVAIVLLISFSTLSKTVLTGAGASFPAPIYAKWAYQYQKDTGNKVNYQDIGSFGGVKQILANTVDFGASDIPLSEEKLNKNDLFQFPTVVSGVVLVINLPGIQSGEIALDGKVLSNIYLNKIKRWDDEEILKLNPGLRIPSKSIIVVHRADSSGTSCIFTKYLAKVNEEWKSKVGIGSVVNWPVGLGGKGNNGVAAFVQHLPGSIGYVEYAFAKQNNLTYTKLISADGKPVIPTEKTFSNAIDGMNWSKSFSLDLINQKGCCAWPITSATFILLHKGGKQLNHSVEVLKFFDWAYKNGSKQANELGYASLSRNLIEQIHLSWRKNMKVISKKEL